MCRRDTACAGSRRPGKPRDRSELSQHPRGMPQLGQQMLQAHAQILAEAVPDAAPRWRYAYTMPVIAKLIPRRNRTWTEIVIEGAVSVRLPNEHVPGGLAAGEPITPELWDALSVQSAYDLLYDKALRLLSRREHFIAELKRKLEGPQVSEAHVARAVAECQRMGYLDDRRAATTFTAQLLARGGIGRAKLRQELFTRGCPPALAAEIVQTQAGAIDEAGEVARLLAAHRQHFASKLASLSRKLKPAARSERELAMQLRLRLSAAVAAYLAGRGFSGEDTRHAAVRFVQDLLGVAEEG